MLSEGSTVKGSPLALVSREVPRFHGGSLWHSDTLFAHYSIIYVIHMMA